MSDEHNTSLVTTELAMEECDFDLQSDLDLNIKKSDVDYENDRPPIVDFDDVYSDLETLVPCQSDISLSLENFDGGRFSSSEGMALVLLESQIALLVSATCMLAMN